MTTQSITGLIGSDTSACRHTLSIGMRTPAISISIDVWPEVTTATFLALMVPLLVRTPAIWPPSRIMPVTSQFWVTSTPIESMARA
jgi:hypothetical protein